MTANLKPKEMPSLSSFNWEDPFRLDDQLSEDERMIRIPPVLMRRSG